MSRRTAVLCCTSYGCDAIGAMCCARHSTFAASLIFAQTILVLGVVALLEQHSLPEPPAK